MIIRKKVWKEYYKDIVSGENNFDLRLGDFDVHKGDILLLEEFDPDTETYTGEYVCKKVSGVYRFDINNMFWNKKEIIGKGVVVVSLNSIGDKDAC